ncbi:MAG: SET domain protein [Hyperionvirus sp.]|uniref:SET domain protein n=1 Tax=Hyperionvirus sp. TaxID=2487770 RepID=A0A3G5A5C9_9VIRU|nr:MAG: SET domain protein [Hyperionvirus sp.]
MESVNAYVKISSIPGIGLGLFAKVDIKAGQIIAEYKGKLIHPRTKNNTKGGVITFKDGYKLLCYVDDLASCTNDCVDYPKFQRKLIASLESDEAFYKRYPGTNINASLDLKQDEMPYRAFLVAYTDIPKDQEIFCHYGFAFWFKNESQRGFIIEKEIQTNGFPEDLTKYKAFDGYLKEFFPDLISSSLSGDKLTIKLKDDVLRYIEVPDCRALLNVVDSKQFKKMVRRDG